MANLRTGRTSLELSFSSSSTRKSAPSKKTMLASLPLFMIYRKQPASKPTIVHDLQKATKKYWFIRGDVDVRGTWRLGRVWGGDVVLHSGLALGIAMLRLSVKHGPGPTMWHDTPCIGPNGERSQRPSSLKCHSILNGDHLRSLGGMPVCFIASGPKEDGTHTMSYFWNSTELGTKLQVCFGVGLVMHHSYCTFEVNLGRTNDGNIGF